MDSNNNNNNNIPNNTTPQNSNVQYSWIPTLSLGPSNTVSIHIHNASLLTSSNAVASSSGLLFHDEKKDEHDESSSVVQCRLEAHVTFFGESIQASPVSTRSTVPLNNGKCQRRVHFDGVLRLPVRWRDLTRDASLVLNVYCTSCCSCCDDDHNLNGSNNNNMVWGTTLPLFDSRGVLRTGLQKLTLHPGLTGDGGMTYLQSLENNAIESFLTGGATPGISIDAEEDKPFHPFCRIDERKLNNNDDDDDPKWKASLILHELNRNSTSAITAAASNVSMFESTGAGGGSNNNNLPTTTTTTKGGGGGRITTKSGWLDDLTRQRCMDILNQPDDDSLGLLLSNNDETEFTDTASNSNNNSSNNNLHRCKNANYPTSSDRDTPYLIIELPSNPSIPILHEEPIYPVESSTHLRGTTGSITANELIKFHSKFRSSYNDDNCNNDVKEDVGTNNNNEQPKSNENNGCGNLTVNISPLAMETPQKLMKQDNNISFAQSFLYPLVQTLDYEPPLAEDNEEDNPFQDKYRILAHDLIRGLVDPGLKPNRIERLRLERIINSPNHHLCTEEKDLLWKFRFSLVDNRRALTKFLLAVDWSVESEVVQAAELLEQWRKRSPIEVTDALKLLGRNVAFQTGLVRSYAIETLSSAPDEELHLYLLQLVQALKYEEDVSGGISGGDTIDSGRSNKARVSSLATFLIERASRNIELANFLYW
eukprot:scaffold1630_cov107-Cyclotella_meneghiniana.AAC.1